MLFLQTIFAVRLEICFFFRSPNIFEGIQLFVSRERSPKLNFTFCGDFHLASADDHKAVRSAATDQGKIKNSTSGLEVS